jgi:hypothetical protein
VSITGIELKDNSSINFGDVSQKQNAVLDFSCIQMTSLANDLKTGIASEFMNTLNNNFSSDILDKLEAKAASSAKNSFGSTGNSNSDTNTIVENDMSSTNKTRVNINTLVQNTVNNTLNMNSVNECINNVKTSQLVEISNIKASGNASATIANISQEQSSVLVATCTQTSNIGSSLTNNIASALGITVASDNSQKKSSTISNTATADSTATGVGEASNQFFSGVGNMFTGIGNMIGMSTLNMLMPCSVCVFIILIGLCILSCLGYGAKVFLFDNKTSESDGSDGNGSDGNGSDGNGSDGNGSNDYVDYEENP